MPSLVIAQGPKAGARFVVENELVVGRSESCSVSIVDNKMSRRHARVRLRNGRCMVADLGSRNGTFLNGEKLEHELPLSPGDRLQIGDTTFLFDPPMRAIVVDEPVSRLEATPVEELLPVAGATAVVLQTATAILAAPSEAAVLRCAADAAMRALGADVGAALLPGEQGLLTAAIAGAPEALIPRSLLSSAVERREAALADSAATVPLWSGMNAFGLLYVSRAAEPITRDELGLLSALGRIAGEALTQTHLAALGYEQDPLVGTARNWRRVLDLVRRAAASTSPVVLVGQHGVGKSLIGAYLHSRSARAAGPLVRVDCRGVPSAIQDELFGRPAGPGLAPLPSALARADGGTLLLLDLEALDRPAAERLARHLSRASAPTLGGGEAPSDARIVATTREHPDGLLARGDIDPALATALKGAVIDIPALRERPSDVSLLFDHFAARVARRAGHPPPPLSDEARQLLSNYTWPGNVRELRLCAERIALLGLKGEVTRAHLPREIQEGSIEGGDATLGDLVGRIEKDTIAAALRKAGGKKIRAAALLGISRPTLDKKIALYGLKVR
jgi:DNA-binding NtrC family response regulator